MQNSLVAGWLALAAGGAFVQAGLVHEPELAEISGIAASRARPGTFWVHNDSGNPPVIFAIDHQGRMQQRVAVRGARNIDWEDIAWFEEDGKPYLAIADIGDNLGWRSHLTIYIVPEPAQGVAWVKPLRRIEFRFEDGARDAEALAVDARAGKILIFEKRRPPALYELALHPPDDSVQLARRVVVLPSEWAPRAPPVETYNAIKFRSVPTAMDISRDGRRLLLLTPTMLLVFARQAGQSWAEVMSLPPQDVQRVPRIAGFEAGCFDTDDRSVWLAHEGLPTALFWLKR